MSAVSDADARCHQLRAVLRGLRDAAGVYGLPRDETDEIVALVCVFKGRLKDAAEALDAAEKAAEEAA